MKFTLFSQILALVDRNIFNKLVNRHCTDKYNKGINSWTHFVTMLFMQLAKANSLRDISNGMRSATGNLSHLGVSRAPSKSTLSYINEHRSADLFMDLYFALLDTLEPSLQRRKKYVRHLKRKVFIMDSSIIPLALSLFDWAKFRTTKGAIKLHAVLDYDWLYNLDSNGVFFVTRLKSNADIEVVESFLINDKHDHILSDQDIRLTGFYSSKKYPKRLRIVRVYDEKNEQTLILLTNQLSWTADTISQLYKARWDVEVFFKHLKQLFKIRTFVGTSENAVRIQMWCSMIAILLLRCLKNKAQYKWHLSNLITFLRINLFVKIDLWKWVNNPVLEKANSPPKNTFF